MKTFASRRGTGIAALAAALMFVAGVCFADDKDGTTATKPEFRRQLGSASSKIKREGDKTYVWAGGKPSGPGAKWYDFTGSLIPPEELQFGIGKDRIPSIDDPLFVSPDDSRLLKFGTSHYRKEEQAKTNDEINIIGFVEGGEARAYPIGLLDRHELVNDKIGGKPVVVGWWPLVKMSVVYGREKNGEIDEFGVSGYVHKNTFLIYDRKTESLWYPLDDTQWTAISGPRKGETIPFIEEPPIETLGEWRKKHPDTVVLLGSKKTIESADQG